VNFTLKEVLCPAANVSGVLGGETRLKRLPVRLIWDTVTEVLLELLVMVTELVLVLPTATLPKLKLVGDAASCPEACPLPVSGMSRLESDASDATVNVPVALPPAVGVNFTLNDVL
jgi:hypothetical protein